MISVTKELIHNLWYNEIYKELLEKLRSLVRREKYNCYTISQIVNDENLHKQLITDSKLTQGNFNKQGMTFKAEVEITFLRVEENIKSDGFIKKIRYYTDILIDPLKLYDSLFTKEVPIYENLEKDMFNEDTHDDREILQSVMSFKKREHIEIRLMLTSMLEKDIPIMRMLKYYDLKVKTTKNKYLRLENLLHKWTIYA